MFQMKDAKDTKYGFWPARLVVGGGAYDMCK